MKSRVSSHAALPGLTSAWQNYWGLFIPNARRAATRCLVVSRDCYAAQRVGSEPVYLRGGFFGEKYRRSPLFLTTKLSTSESAGSRPSRCFERQALDHFVERERLTLTAWLPARRGLRLLPQAKITFGEI